LTGSDAQFGMVDQVALGIHLLGEEPRGVKVRKDHVAIKCENRLVELVTLAGLAGNMEFIEDIE